MKGKEGHCVANFATFVPKTLLYISIENKKNKNGCNKVVIELSVVQAWSEITLAVYSFNFEITRMISDQIALHLIQLPI